MSYSWRGRIGLLLPAVNTTMERDFWRYAPEGVTVHATRLASGHEGSAENLRGMAGSAVDAARLLAFSQPSAAVFGCTSGSFVDGPAGNAAMEEELAAVLDCPTVTTSTAMVEALQAVGAHRVGVVTPYVEETNMRLGDYVSTAGFDVADVRGLGVLDMFAHAQITRDDIYRAAMGFAGESVDAVFVACTQLQITDEIAVLERDLGVPVIGAVQCSLWAALHRMGGVGLPLTGAGSLMTAPLDHAVTV
jgi:maleate cis-trans isomerase